jgi:hypothetical protein
MREEHKLFRTMLNVAGFYLLTIILLSIPVITSAVIIAPEGCSNLVNTSTSSGNTVSYTYYNTCDDLSFSGAEKIYFLQLWTLYFLAIGIIFYLWSLFWNFMKRSIR